MRGNGINWMARHFTAEDRVRLLTDYAASPLTVRKYANEKGVSYSTFHKWALKQGISLRKKETAETLGLAALTVRRDQQSSVPGQFKDITADILLKSSPARVAPSLSTELLTSSSSLSKSDTSFLTSGQMDIFLPKGVKMTFHQVPLTYSLALMKALL